ncbi:hypothetical protein DRE_07309 [Drechslerella stenobrocha 248]|uniref:Transcription factor tau subunit sfc6 n=1 Tax=Drechslerella stenobrocha 248 TaxID=1043628 RepID=W7I4X7_9PEZI|nr:hypothetical protein DRE_07309 [Drechslerella stenobrocha 248]
MATSNITIPITPTRPKRQAALRRKPVLDHESSSDETEQRTPKRRAELRSGGLASDPHDFEFRPSDSGAKASDDLEFGGGDAARDIGGSDPDEGDPDGAELSDDDDMDIDDGRAIQRPGPRKPKNGKNRNTPVALHRRMVRKIKDISYWGDVDVDPAALKRKRAAQPFTYDISAPSRCNIRQVWYLDIEKEAQDLAKDIYIGRTRSRQQTTLLDKVADADDIARYYWQFPKQPLTLFLGPFTRSGQQKKVELKMHDSVSLTDPGLFRSKNGWVIHAGNEVQSLDWATRQPGTTQFLAIGVKFQEAKPTMNDRPSGFAPCVCPSQIQIWRIPISKPNTAPKPPPTLDCTLLTDWGAATEIKWRPGSAPIPDHESATIGHLVALFEDGKARLIEIKNHNNPADPPIYKLTTPMLTLHLRDALFTVFTWIDHHTIAFGCSNGSIAIYDLNITQPGKEHLPKSYHSIHASYVASICSLSPSFPDLIASYSMDGSFHLHDLREPNPSNTLVHRSRTVAMSAPIVWSEMAQSLCYPEDLSGVLCMGIRKVKRFGGFLCSNNPGDCMAASSIPGLHPFLLNGGRDGKVRIVNLIRKYFYAKCQAMQQVWFQLEYAPSTEAYRMLDGFKLEMVVHRNRVAIGLPFYSYHTNVTKACWNGNKEYATWAAAGMGCGLVRVEDISLDVHEAVPDDEEAAVEDM